MLRRIHSLHCTTKSEREQALVETRAAPNVYNASSRLLFLAVFTFRYLYRSFFFPSLLLPLCVRTSIRVHYLPDLYREFLLHTASFL